MKKALSLLLLVIAIPAFAQFKYLAWDLGPQIGSFKINNGFAQYAQNGPNTSDVFLADSANAQYKMTNLVVNIDAITPKYFVKFNGTFPLGKHAEQDSVAVLGKHFAGTMEFGYGFAIKEKVGFQFGLNMGIFNIVQAIPNGGGKSDYFVPSAGSTALTGQKMFGGMGAWEGGFLVSNVIAFSDQLGLQTTFSYNNLAYKRRTVSGKNAQLEFNLVYSNPDWHNIGFNIGFTQNWINFKGYTLADSEKANAFDRIYPASKVNMTTFYFGVNIPIAFDE